MDINVLSWRGVYATYGGWEVWMGIIWGIVVGYDGMLLYPIYKPIGYLWVLRIDGYRYV
jgi:hypothetical protein